MARKKTAAMAAMGMGVLVLGGIIYAVMGGDPPPYEERRTDEVSETRGREVVDDHPGVGELPGTPVVDDSENDGVVRGRLLRGNPAEPTAGRVRISGSGASADMAVSPDGLFRVEGLLRFRDIDITLSSDGVETVRYIGMRVGAQNPLNLGDIVLGVPQPLTVEVRDGAGRSLAEATVTLHRTIPWGYGQDWILRQVDPPPAPPAQHTQTTGADGRTTFPRVAPGSWTVRATRDGLADGHATASVTEGARGDPTRVMLTDAGTLSGRVVDPDGAPLAGLEVFGNSGNYWSMPSMASKTSVTGEKGEYELTGLSSGNVTVGIRRGTASMRTFGIVKIPDVETFDIVLEPGGSIHGSVTDEKTGEAVEGAVVSANAWDPTGRGGQTMGMAVTAADGSYELPDLGRGNVGQVTARKDGYLASNSSQMTQVPLRPESPVERNVKMRKGVPVTGKVLDGNGEPVSGATVFLQVWDPRRGMVPSDRARSGPDGSYTVAGAAPGKALAQVTAAGYYQKDYPRNYWQMMQSGNIPDHLRVDIPVDGEVTKDLVIEVGGSVSGTVQNEDGSPVAGVTVRLSGPKEVGGGTAAPTAEDGTFVVVGVKPGENITATTSGPSGSSGKSEKFSVTEGTPYSGLLVTMKPGATISGTVSRSDAGDLRNVSLLVVSGDYTGPNRQNLAWARNNAVTHPVDDDGTFSIEGQRAGVWTVLCVADGCAETVGPKITVTAGKDSDGVTIELKPEREFVGRVVLPDGTPVASATITYLVQTQNTGMMSPNMNSVAAVTDADGKFALHHMGDAVYQVTARKAGFVNATRNVKKEDTEVELTMKAGLAIAGVVTDEATGQPASGIPVYANSTTPQAGVVYQSLQSVTAKDGSFRIDGTAHDEDYNVTLGQSWGNNEHGYTVKVVQKVASGTEDLRVTV
ncbi:MAG: carboxypeptidase regulatory-like domain-containing protein, partial [Planctomycetota bacterium]